MNAILLDLLPWVRQGYCCSQLLMLLALQARGEENPALVRAQWGFCQGMANGACGLLLGGVSALSSLIGAAGDAPHPMAAALLSDYAAWFEQRTAVYGGSSCECIGTALLGASPRGGGPADLTGCGDLLAECWEKMTELAAAYDVDLTQPRTEA